MSDVIDLCDSGGEEETEIVETFQFQTSSSSPTAPATGAAKLPAAGGATQTQSTAAASSDDDDDVVEILDDDDDDEAIHVTPSARKTQQQSSNAPLTDSGVRPKILNPYRKRQSTPRVLPAAVPVRQNPYAQKNPYTKENPYTQKNPYTKEKCPPVASAASRRPVHNDESSDSEEEDFRQAYKPSGLLYNSSKKRQSANISATRAEPEDEMKPAAACKSAVEGPRRVSSGGPATKSSQALPSPISVVRSSSSPSNDAPFLYPKLLPNSIMYPDIRAKLVLAFWKISRTQALKSYEQGRLDHTVKKLVRVALSPHPIRSLEEYCFSRGVGGGGGATPADQANRKKLEDQLTEVHWESVDTPMIQHKYYSVAEACLVAMLNEMERRISQGISEDLEKPELWISLEYLIPLIDSLLWERSPKRLVRGNCDDNGASYYTNPSTKSAEFLQICMLERRLSLQDEDSCIKRHTKRGKLFYELRPFGRETAVGIRDRTYPAALGHYRRSRIQTQSQVEEKYRGVCLGMDLREGGGGNSSLHDMCNVLEMSKVPYFVGAMAVGDYVWFTNKDGSSGLDYMCPILVERKSVEDVAMSIYDNRWIEQKRRMYHGQYVFGYDNCRIAFIIEGNVNKHTITGGYVGQRHYGVTQAQFEEAVEELQSEGFEVIMAPSRKHTMFELARWTERVARDMKTGKLKAQYTYAEFKRQVNRIPATVDFSRLAKAAMAGKRLVEVAIAAAGSKRSASKNSDSDSDSDLEVASVDSSAAIIVPKRPKKDRMESSKYGDWSQAQLKAECKKFGLPQTGRRDELVARLHGPRPPPLWLARRSKGQYVPPRHNVGANALLVGLYLHEKTTGSTAGMTKEELYPKAESLQITKNPFCGGTTQTGPYHYDGWSSMKCLLEGDPPLVSRSRGRYKLTRNSDIAGYHLAEQLHAWCHLHGNCQCGATSVAMY